MNSRLAMGTGATLLLWGMTLCVLGCRNESSSHGNGSMDSGIADAGHTDPAPDDTGTPSVDGAVPDTEAPAHVLYDIMSDPVVLPFPSNYHLDPDDLSVQVGGVHYSNELLGASQEDMNIRNALATVHGFATYSPVALLLSQAPQEDSLPASGEESLQEDSSVMLLAEAGDGSHYERLPVRVEYRIYESRRIVRHLLLVTPLGALRPSTTHLLVINDHLLDSAGRPFGRSPGFSFLVGEEAPPASSCPNRAAIVLRERQRLGQHLEKLPHPERVVSLVDFTTGDGLPVMRSVMDRFLPDGDGETPTELPTIDYTIHSEEDDQTGVFWDGTFPDCVAGPEVMSYGIKGLFAPVNLMGPEGRFHTEDGGSQGEFQEFPREDIFFWLMVPAAHGTGSLHGDDQGFPIVIVQHGIDYDQSQLCGISLALLEAGMAVLRFDWPHHGHRGSGGLQFLNLQDFRAVRDNFRQASVELASAVLLLDRLVESGELDYLPRDEPDGIPDLDPARLAYLGFSMGGVIGALHAPFSNRLTTMVLPFSGMGIFHVIDAFLNNITWTYQATVTALLGQQVGWVADGVTYAHHILGHPLAGLPMERNVLIQQAIGDGTMPNLCTEILVRNVGIPAIERALVPIEGVSVVPAEGASSGLWQVEGLTHDHYFMHPEHPQVAQLWRQAVHYLRTYFDTGTPVILTQ